MGHIAVSNETKKQVNKCKGLMQSKSEDLITYDKVIKKLCLYYLNSVGGKL